MTRTALAILITVSLTSLNAAAQEGNPPPPASPSQPAASAPVAEVKKLGRRERKELMAKLSAEYRQWLLDVEPIIQPEERDAFLLLESNAQRDRFIESFWERRDRDNRTARNEYRDEYMELLAEARSRFKDTVSDRSVILLTRGRPAAEWKIDCSRYLQPIEVWYYSYIAGFGRDVYLLFYQPRVGSGWRLWTPRGSGQFDNFKELLSFEGEQQGVAELLGGIPNPIQTYCRDGEKVMAAVAWTERNKLTLDKVFDVPDVETEDLDNILRASVVANPDAPKLPAEFSTRYPGKRGGRTAVELNVTIPADQLTPKVIEDARVFNLDVTGEILREGRIFDNFRYRFDYPQEVVGDVVPVMIERFLRPATYTARLRVVDINTGAEAIVEKELEVPEIRETLARSQAARDGAARLNQLHQEYREGESRLRIVPLGNELLTGLQKIEAIVSGDDIASVEFYLDGKKVMTRRSAPWTLDLDFGNVPQTRRVKVVAKNAEDQIVTGDELVLNTGTDPFRVRIVRPRVFASLSGDVRVEIEADVPAGRELENVELWYNETKLATLYNPPFVQTVRIPSQESIGYLRATAALKDDPYDTAVEDIVFINTPEYLQQINVHLVELPTTVVDGSGRVITDLTESDFAVTDNGQAVDLAKFEYVKNLPLSIGLAVDASGSMRDRMLEAQKAGAEFFKSLMKPSDRAFVVAFDSQPAIIQKWTSQVSDVNAGLATLRAEDTTALYDAVILSLYNFLGVRGQKALVVISDGQDTSSKFSWDQTLEYARRSGVPIYAIGLGIRSSSVEVRYKLNQLASQTGGYTYYIDRASELRKVYDEIETELRSQYLLGFYPPEEVKPGDKWREVTVRSTRGKVRTISGYYP